MATASTGEKRRKKVAGFLVDLCERIESGGMTDKAILLAIKSIAPEAARLVKDGTIPAPVLQKGEGPVLPYRWPEAGKEVTPAKKGAVRRKKGG